MGMLAQISDAVNAAFAEYKKEFGENAQITDGTEFVTVFIAVQLIGFIPFYFIWRKDCKEIGKENLAVSLKERFWAWCLSFPFWLFPIIYLARYNK